MALLLLWKCRAVLFSCCRQTSLLSLIAKNDYDVKMNVVLSGVTFDYADIKEHYNAYSCILLFPTKSRNNKVKSIVASVHAMKTWEEVGLCLAPLILNLGTT
jgi:hypothetical protein